MTISKAYAQMFENAGSRRADGAGLTVCGIRAERLRLFGFALLAFLGAGFLTACGGGNSAITLEVTPNTSQTVDQGQVIQFTALLGNDTGMKGVTWMPLTGTGCAGTGCGTLTNITKTSVTYTAPTNSSIALTVSLEAVANASTGVNVTTMISVVLPPTFTTTTLVNGSNGGQYSQQVAVTGGVPPLVFSVVCPNNQPTCLPPGLTLNQNGTLLGVPTTSGTYPFFVKATDRGGVPVIGQPPPFSVTSTLFTVIINPATPLSVSTTSLPPGTVNQPYNISLTARGGATPYTWSVTPNSLPPGLALNISTGQISGTPTTVGSFPLIATVQDSSVPVQSASSGPLTISVQSPSPLHITTASLPSGMTATSYNTTLNASGGTPPFTWSVINGQLPAGLTLDAQTGLISGIPILLGTSTFTVQVQDSSAGGPAKATQLFNLTITAGSTSSNSLIEGNYSFLFSGFDANGTVVIAGNFSANGSGGITNGQEDINRVTGVAVAASLTGSYSVGTDGRGTMQLVATNGNLTVFTSNYLLALDSSGNIHVIEDETVPTNGVGITHGSGIMKVSVGSFVTSNFAGNYAFEFSGQDFLTEPTVLAGVVNPDGEQIFRSGTVDFNDGGVYSPQLSLTGGFAVGNANSKGLATMTFLPPTGQQITLTFTFYFVSADDIFFAEIDAASSTNTLPRLSGEMFLQNTGTQFNQSSLQGTGVVTGTGLAGTGIEGSNSTVFAGLLTSTLGDGTANLSFDQNAGGTVTPLTSASGTYQVFQNGRVGFTGLGNRVAAAYLIGPDQGFIIGSDTAATYGLLEQQSGAPFSPSSVQGTYVLSAPQEADTLAVNMIGELSSAGAGNFVGTLDEFIPPSGPPSTDIPFSASYSVTADGRGNMRPILIAGFPTNLVFYVVSPSDVRMISLDSNVGNGHPQVIFLSH
ncbi:MAG: Ig domain-containing protein [Candidatus Acidiferrales bacterium]